MNMDPSEGKTPPRFPKKLWIGILILIFGSGPLLLTGLLASLGVTSDPNPNPIGFGILAGLTFWPGVIMTVWDAIQFFRRSNDQ